jgi:hypothetical protein
VEKKNRKTEKGGIFLDCVLGLGVDVSEKRRILCPYRDVFCSCFLFFVSVGPFLSITHLYILSPFGTLFPYDT